MLSKTLFMAKRRQPPIIALPIRHINCKGKASFLGPSDDLLGNMR